MRHRISERIISVLLVIVMVVGMMPATAYARTVLPQTGTGTINLVMTLDGILTWDSVPGADSYYFTITDGSSTWYVDESYTSTSFNFIENFDSRKIDSGLYRINLRANGSGVYDITGELIYYYVSPYDKLEAPANLRWEGTTAKWDAVSNATGYTVYLYKASGTQYSSYKIDGNTNTSKDFSDVYGLNSGWWFKVEATSTATAPETIYRDSNMNESPKQCQSRENAAQTVSGNINLQMSSDGILTWDSIPGATDYYFTIGNVGSTYYFDSNYDDTSLNFLENFDSRKMDSGVYKLSVKANGSGDVYNKSGVLTYYYVSPYNKLEAPTNLRWEGTTAKWDAVPYATGYTVYLHQASGTQYASYKIDGNANTSKDFSGVSGLSGGWWFEIEATSTAVTPDTIYRDSDRNESPKTSKMSSITYAINCFAYDINNMEFAGGTVSVETDMDASDGTVVYGTASEKTIARIEAVADEGYEFVEWRKASPDNPSAMISKNENHALLAMEEMWLYAVFQEEGTETIFPAGAGYSASNPAKCSTYEEFKYAMEHEDISYVSLGNVDEILPELEGDELIYAINVKGTKTLYLLGQVVFSAPVNGKTYDSLLQVGTGSSLNIRGTGNLTFEAVGTATANAVIRNQGGDVCMYSGGLNGAYNTATYGIAIWQEYGNLTIYDGSIRNECAAPHYMASSSATYPVYLMGGTTQIYGGDFYSNGYITGNTEYYGLAIKNGADVNIYGGTFQGIMLGAGARLGNYIAEGYVVTYNGEKINPANYNSIPGTVEIQVFREVSKADVNINSPTAGNSVYNKVYGVPDGCYVHTVLWYEDGECIDSHDNFTAGKSYRVEIYLMVEDGVKFADPMTSATINYDEDTTVAANGNDAKKSIVLSLDMGICPATVPKVELTITAPKEGNKPSYTVGCGNDTYYAVGGSSNYTEYRKWMMSSDGDDWWEINESHTFLSGYYYKLYVDIRTRDDYEFPVYDNGITIMPYVTATVNGHTANVIKAYEQDPGRYITVEYDFGECNDSMVESIIVIDVKQPVAGECPTYLCSTLGSGYKINTDKNVYYDAYWLNPAEKWYYIKNGIGWYDLTENDWVYEHETFIAGHEYQINVYLVTKDGYGFAHDKYYAPKVTATVNGESADICISGSDCTWSQQVTCGFTCEEQEMVMGTITSFGSDTDDIIVQLIPKGLTEVAYETYVSGTL
ncbi:MAG: hypothetical protein IJB96_01580, partial [Lachnospira sp.]|nr:hypothetical protein [Lachnospira sp.]